MFAEFMVSPTLSAAGGKAVTDCNRTMNEFAEAVLSEIKTARGQ